MNSAQIIPLADSWGMHSGSGWWVLGAAVMMVFMGGMMWMMMRGMGGSSQQSSAPWERFGTKETPLETLERRFAEGEISVEEYRTRREVLVDGAAEGNGSDKHETVTTSGREGGP